MVRTAAEVGITGQSWEKVRDRGETVRLGGESVRLRGEAGGKLGQTVF